MTCIKYSKLLICLQTNSLAFLLNSHFLPHFPKKLWSIKPWVYQFWIVLAISLSIPYLSVSPWINFNSLPDPLGRGRRAVKYNVRKASNILLKWAFSVQTTVWFLWDFISTEQKPNTDAFDFSLRVGYGWLEEPEKMQQRNTEAV